MAGQVRVAYEVDVEGRVIGRMEKTSLTLSADFAESG